MADFPLDDYTPHGYIGNPYHCWKLNRSGLIRSRPSCGFGWLYPGLPSSYGWIHFYSSYLNMAIKVGRNRFYEPSDFSYADVHLVSRYHSKNIVSYDFTYRDIEVSYKFFLAFENALACWVELKNLGTKRVKAILSAIHCYSKYNKLSGLWEQGLTGRYDKDKEALITKGYSEGVAFALKSSGRMSSYGMDISEDKIREWLDKGYAKIGEKGFFSFSGVGRTDEYPFFGMVTYELDISAGDIIQQIFALGRGYTEEEALEETDKTLDNFTKLHLIRLADDNRFWNTAAGLTGDWPDHWRRGWVYDMETLRMCVHKPVGIYKHYWDMMQTQAPRTVLAEAALDMLLLSYGDEEIAKEVLLGTFADAPAPNIPCSREDGSYNMIAENGEACGTAPEWVFPFHCIHSIYCRFPDKKWLEDIYPYLIAYLEWWLKNRSDEEGWLYYLCSWESGQDESRRFGYQVDGGVLVTQYRPVDLQASFAQASNIMSFFASELDLSFDEEKWKALAEDFTNKTLNMWQNGWFRDYDSENGVWSSFRDTMQIAPVFCQIATDEQIEELTSYFENIDRAEPFIWPTFSFVALESTWQAKQRDVASTITYKVVDRVYRKWDRNIYLGEESLPGISCEYWPYQDKWGSEGYGWGATGMVLLVRNIIGFRETQEMDSICFILAPCLPEQLLQVGKTYAIENLKYRDLKLKLSYTVEENEKIKMNIAYRSSSNRLWKVEIFDKDKEEVALNMGELERDGEIEFIGDNGALYEVRFYEVERS